MKQLQPIPLAQRLRQAGAAQPEPYFLHFYRFYLDTYLGALACLPGDGPGLADRLEERLTPYLARYGEAPLLVEFVADCMELPLRERGELLYWVLAEPFAADRGDG